MAANSKSFRSAGCLRWKSKLSALAALLGISLASTHSVRAQAPEGITLKVDLVAWGDTIAGLSFRAETSTDTITALPFRYAKPVTYKGPPLMTIHQHSTSGVTDQPSVAVADAKEHESRPLSINETADAANQPQRQKTGLALELEKRREKEPTLVALAKIPSGCTRATVLLAPNGDGTFQTMVVDDNPAKLPPGKLRVQNLSPYPIAMRFNGKGAAPKELKRNEATLVDAPGEQVIYELAYKLGQEWKFQENNILPVRSNEQTQMIVLRSDNRFFLSSDGATGGFLQNVVLRREPNR